MNPSIVNWREIDTVLLDMDGTLLDLHYDNYFWREYLPRKVSERDGIPLATCRETVLPKLLASIGSLDFYCIEHWSRVFDIDILALKREIAGKIAVRSGAIAFLDYLRESGKTVALATNAHPATVELKLDKTNLHRYFDVVCCSHDYGHAKEHAPFWPALRDHLDIDFERTLFIDDTPRVLEAARKGGIRFLMGIRRPDSQREAVDTADFPTTDDFAELLQHH
ncbi:MAG: GMP/IMP nucleotidase [Pseudomonadota bacterium]